jgi:hypothetical protein
VLDDTEGEEQRIAGNMAVERKSQKRTRAQREPRKKKPRRLFLFGREQLWNVVVAKEERRSRRFDGKKD